MITGKTSRVRRWLDHPNSEVDATINRPYPFAKPEGEWSRQIERFVGDYPIASVAAAVAVGVLLGWLVKRR